MFGISRIGVLLLVGVLTCVLLGTFWRVARRARAGRKRRLRWLEMELRLADASDAFDQALLRLRYYRALRPHPPSLNTGLIRSTKVPQQK